MAWNSHINVTTASLRAADYDHFKAMRTGSAKLRDSIHRARGGTVRSADAGPRARLLEISWMPPVSDKPLTLDDVRNAVAKFYNLDPVYMRAASRKATHVRARAVAMAVMHRRGNSYAAIAPWFGFADHTTVRHHVIALADKATEHERELIDRLSPVIAEASDEPA